MTLRRALVLLPALAACGTPEYDAEVVIVRGDPASEWLDLSITGSALDAPDGTAVILQIGMPDRPPERLGHAVARLADGAFTVDFPDVWELGLYKKKVLLLDLDADGACGEGELVLVDFSASLEDRAMTISPPTTGAAIWGDFFPGACTDVVADWPAE